MGAKSFLCLPLSFQRFELKIFFLFFSSFFFSPLFKVDEIWLFVLLGVNNYSKTKLIKNTRTIQKENLTLNIYYFHTFKYDNDYPLHLNCYRKAQNKKKIFFKLDPQKCGKQSVSDIVHLGFVLNIRTFMQLRPIIVYPDGRAKPCEVLITVIRGITLSNSGSTREIFPRNVYFQWQPDHFVAFLTVPINSDAHSEVDPPIPITDCTTSL